MPHVMCNKILKKKNQEAVSFLDDLSFCSAIAGENMTPLCFDKYWEANEIFSGNIRQDIQDQEFLV